MLEKLIKGKYRVHFLCRWRLGVSWAGYRRPRYKSCLPSGRLVLTPTHTRCDNLTHPPTASTPGGQDGAKAGLRGVATGRTDVY